jgi:hypothetical protein
MIDYVELLTVASDESLQEQVRESDIVFIGSVISLGKPPNGWSGYGNSYQTVNYKVEKILKGTYTKPEISILHVVVFASLTAQEGDTSALSPELFALQSKLIVSARKTNDGEWKSLAENFGALPATAEWIKKIESALR